MYHAQVNALLEQRQQGSTQLTLYPVCGHVPMDECAEQFQSDVVSFVEGVFAKRVWQSEQHAVLEPPEVGVVPQI